MGCDIRSHVEIWTQAAGWTWIRDFDPTPDEYDDPWEVFPGRNYSLFGFLANVRNYSHVPALDRPRGIPDDLSADLHAKWLDDDGCHGTTWFTVAELLAVNYAQVFEDRRGSSTKSLPEGQGRRTTLRHFLDEDYFRRLDMLAKLSPVAAAIRVVVWFDS